MVLQGGWFAVDLSKGSECLVAEFLQSPCSYTLSLNHTVLKADQARVLLGLGLKCVVKGSVQFLLTSLLQGTLSDGLFLVGRGP